jgi:RNA polymerase sigma-70 factor, ECF subfamily
MIVLWHKVVVEYRVMNTTSASLLHRLRDPAAQVAWERFVKLYTPLLLSWAQRAGLKGQDAADLVQDVFLVLVRKLPAFEYDASKGFRAWLRTITLNKWRDRVRQQAIRPGARDPAQFDELAEPSGDDPFSEMEYRRQVLRAALDLLRPEFQESTWRAFLEHGLAGRPAQEVAAELKLRPGAVYAAKFRVLARLRAELAELVDSNFSESSHLA